MTPSAPIHRTTTLRLAAAALSVLLVMLAACSDNKGSAPAAAGPPGGGMPPAQVGVVTVQPQSVALQTELPGRIDPVRVAQVRARVTGIVQKRLFEEGSLVKAGQVLFQIDTAPYQAAVDSAGAQLARSQAVLAQSTATADRYRPLAEAKAIAQQDYVNAAAVQKSSEADVAAARAGLQTARINLGYARVTAPISGRIGRALVTEGALVSATEATQLAVVQQISTVYVNFTQSSGDVLQLRKAVAANQLRRVGNNGVAVHVLLEDGSELPRTGKLLFSDLTVDSTSGQITLRAEVPNPDGLLLPGQYVRVRLAQAELPAGILLPQQAVTRTAQGDSVLVIGDGNKPVPRQIRIANGQNGQWVVTGGLNAGDRVIVDGFQKMMVPGAPVNPVPWSPPASGAGGAGGPGGVSGSGGPGSAGGAMAASGAASGAAPAAAPRASPVAARQ